MSYQNLLVETREGIAFVTINRPDKLNALDALTLSELHAAFGAARADADVQGVILTGSGSKAFVAGADIEELSRQTPADGHETSRRGQRMLDDLLPPRVPLRREVPRHQGRIGIADVEVFDVGTVVDLGRVDLCATRPHGNPSGLIDQVEGARTPLALPGLAPAALAVRAKERVLPPHAVDAGLG